VTDNVAGGTANNDTRPKSITPAAKRALAEAEERRKDIDAVAKSMPKELKGRKGLEPSRYGDWEKDGITSDF